MKHFRILSLSFLFFLMTDFYSSAQSCPSWGPYVTASQMPGNADLIMSDVMIPDSGNMPDTYTCAIQFSLGKSGGYCGLQNTNDGLQELRPFNNIFSVWDYPNNIQIIHTYKDPLTFVGGFGNEGTGLHSHCDFGWKPNHWYTNVVRRWYDDKDSSKTYAAYFIYDQTKKEWTQYVTFDVPETDAKFHGNLSGFLENFADDKKRTRTSYYKSYWKLTVNNKWIKPKTLDADGGTGNWNAQAYGDDGIQLFSCGKEIINGQKLSVPVTSKDTAPETLTVAAIYDLGAYYDAGQKQLHVDWSLLKSNAPQLFYEIDVYNTQFKNKLITTASGYGPEIRSAVLNTELHIQNNNYTIILKVKDIFNQNAAPKEIVLTQLHS